jgi:glutamyl-tRNA reductase
VNSHKKGVLLVGINHDTAPIEIRERVAFDIAVLSRFCRELKNQIGAEESLILSTCNRTEIYVCGGDVSSVINWLSAVKDVSPDVLRSHDYVFYDHEVLTHAARVACGMNSMVLGETQILGQMKVAYQCSDVSDCLGRILRKLFQSAFSLAKEVRTSTEIGAHSISLASTSLRIAERVFPDMKDRAVLFVGAGEIIELFAQHYSGRSFKTLTFANRTGERAEMLALKYGGDVISIGEAGEKLNRFDIIISCTASPIPIFGKGAVEKSILLRRHNPILVFDLAVPRDIEAGVSELDDVFLFTVDDLGEQIRQGLNLRKDALTQANDIISQGTRDFIDWMHASGSSDVLKAFRGFGQDLVQAELHKSLCALQKNEDAEQVLRKFSNAITKKFLDRPSRALNKAKGRQRDELSLALAKLFNLDDQI